MGSSPGLVSRALRLFRERFLLYLAVAALPYFTVHLGLWWLLLVSPAMQVSPNVPLREQMHSIGNGDLALFVLTWILLLTVPYAIAGRGICRVASFQLESQHTKIGRIAMDMALFVPSAVLLSLIAGLAMSIAMGAFIAPVPFVAALFTLVVPAATIDNLGPFSALSRGMKLAARSYGKLLGLFAGLTLCVLAAFVVQSILLGNLPPTFAARMTVIALVTSLPIVPLILFNICLVLVYVESRGAVPSPPIASEAA